MHITLLPTRLETELTLHRAGETLTINGKVCDFSHVAEGACLPSGTFGCDHLVSEVTRINGVLRLAVILPHAADAPGETLFPAALALTEDGPVALPPFTGSGVPSAG